jgi:hydrogenase maturation factor
MIGEASKSRYLQCNRPEVGDLVVMTKYGGLEGTSILANDLNRILRGKMKPKSNKIAKTLLKDISVVREALISLEVGGVHALHTPTEGGIQNGLYEMAKSSGLGLEVNIESIPFLPETIELSELLDVDPLRLMSSGSLLISIDASKADKLIKELTGSNIRATIIGKFTSAKKSIFINRNTSRDIEPVKQDEVYRIKKLKAFHK